MTTHLYIHYPWCERFYARSAFGRLCFQGQKQADLDAAYVKAIRKQASTPQWLNWFEAPVKSVFIGGGSPAALPAHRLSQLKQALTQCALAMEVSLEAFPEEVIPERLEGWQALGVHRLAIRAEKLCLAKEGPQTLLDALAYSKQWGFEVSVGLYYGASNLSARTLLDYAEQVLDYAPDQISWEVVSPEAESTCIGSKTLTEGAIDQIYNKGVQLFKRRGWKRFGPSYFALKGPPEYLKGCWKQQNVLGLGPYAVSLPYLRRKTGRTFYRGSPRWREFLAQTFNYEATHFNGLYQIEPFLLQRMQDFQPIDSSEWPVLKRSEEQRLAEALKKAEAQGWVVRRAQKTELTDKAYAALEYFVAFIIDALML